MESKSDLYESLPYLAQLVLQLKEEVDKLRELAHRLEVQAAEMGVSNLKSDVSKLQTRVEGLETYKSESVGSFRTANIVWGALWALVVAVLTWKLAR